MYLSQQKLQHINSITHEGKVVVFATDADGKISYTVKQDGFEDSYLNTPPDQRTGWESWKSLELPNEANDQSVIDKETAKLTHQKDTSNFILRSRYKTQTETAVTPVQAISALGHIYVFRQSKSNTLLVDRFVLDGMTNKLNRKLEVRFKRSKQKHTPTKNMNKGSNGLVNIDSLDFRDANGNFFYEPTTELCLVNNLHKGWFSIVLVPTIENDVYRWHIFAYNSQTQKVELTTIRASAEELFDVQDYTIFEESNETLVPRRIPGIIKRTLDISGATITNGLSATKYDLQQAQQTQSGEEQLLKTATKLMLAIPTDKGTAAFSFAIAGDGTLAEIDDTPDSTIIRSQQREILLPLNTLDEIKAIGDRTPPPQGIITGFAEGTDEEDIEDLVKISTNGKAAELANSDLVKITGTSDYQGLYHTKKVDGNTFEIDLPTKVESLGYWEKEDKEEGGLIFDGIITAYEKTADGKLRVICPNHGLENGDEVQITGTENYNDTYPVQKIDDTHFVIERKWATGEAVNIKLISQKRRGIVFDGVNNYVSLPEMNHDFSQGITVEAWVWYDSFNSYSRIIDFGNGSSVNNILLCNEGASNTLRLRIYQQSKEQAINAAGVLETGKWIHLAATIDASGTGKLYKNGEQVQTGKINVPNNLKRTNNYIGKSSWSNDGYFNGKLSDLRIWKVARTAADIKNNMYLQLTGKEVGLVGYWRLGAIAEGKVVDFSVNWNDGIVHGDAYVSAATLNRKLAGGTDAVKYSNSELFAVSERATYEETFEFKVNASTAVDFAYLDNADGKNLGTKIFTLSYWGKSSRSAEEKKTIAAEQIKQSKFEDLGKGWYRVCCNVTIPDGVSMLRSFEITNVKGNWLSLEIRKHRIRLLSDSITEAKYTDGVTLATLVDDHATLAAKLKELELKEKQERILLKEKRELEAKIAAYNAQAATRGEIQKLESKIAALTSEEQTLKSAYQNAVNSPFNYFCQIKCAPGVRNAHGTDFYIWAERDRGYIVGLPASQPPDKWQFIHQGGDFYSIKCAPGVRNAHGTDFYIWAERDRGYIVGLPASQPPDKWQLIKCEPSNTSIDRAQKDWEAKTQELQLAKNDLQRLQKILSATPADKAAWDARLAQVISLITAMQTELNTLNSDFLNAVKNAQAKPQTMSEVTKDSKGLVTQGALLGFVQPGSRLNAIETCEGNVQLSYLDSEGRMRQTNYDATADGKNTAFEQWVLDAQRACLNFSNSNSVVKLNQALYLPSDWSIEAWFCYPLPETEEGNTLIRGKDVDHHILVRNRQQLGIYLTNDSLGQKFYDSGFNMELLTEGWHHLTAVGWGDTTLFYVDGKKVGDVKAKALKDAEENLNKNPNDAAAKKKVEDIKKASLKSKSNVYAIGNNHLSINKPADNTAIKFDGVNDYVEVPYSASLNPSQFTVSCWVKIEGGQGTHRSPLTSRSSVSGLKGYIIYANPENNWELMFGNDSSSSWAVIHGPAIVLNTWTHLTGTYDGNTLTFYINAVAAGTLKTNYALNTTHPLRIGAGATEGNPQFFFPGQIAEVSIWNKARTQAEIKADMSKRLSGKEPNLVAYYPLNEITVEGTTRKVLNLASSSHGTVVEANIVTDKTLSLAPFIQGEQFGKLAEVRIWGIALSDDEIAVNSTMLLSGNEPGLLAYYPMSEATGVEVRDHSGNGNNATVSGVNWWGCTASIGKIDNPSGVDALVCAEYSTVTVESSTKTKVAIMRRFFAYPATNGVTLLPDKRIETLELKWIGNAQFAPTLLGYIEGAPPVPSENLTTQYNAEDDYNGATSVELTMSEDVAFSWTRSQDSGLGMAMDMFAGSQQEVSVGGELFGLSWSQIASSYRYGFKGNFDFSYQFQNESSITSSSSLSMTDKLELHGDYEQEPKFSHLGKRFIPKNIGYALVVSAIADVFVTRLARSGKMVGYQVQPVDGIPPDVNTITFLMNPAYTMNGSLDGLTGSSATTDRFFKHVPEMRSQYGSLYPASYYRLQEAYDLKRSIEAEDKRRESYFSNFDVRLVDETSLNRNIDSGAASTTIGVQREEDKPNTQMTEEEKKKAEEEKHKKEQAEAAEKAKQQQTASEQKQAEIQSKINDQEKRVQATDSFAGWQRRMEDIQIRAGKRNIVNTYVWDADGGLRTEAQSFANTVEHSIGGSFSMNAGLGLEGSIGVAGNMFELSAQATVNLTQTMSKTEARSKGFQLNVDLSGVEFRGITDYNDNPMLPGEKVDRYRFMSFYLEGSTQNFQDFFSYVVDPEWLRSNDEEARALRQAQAGKPNKAWRVLHRVTYVERPALMGFGRDVRKLRAVAEISENQQLLDKIAKLEENNRKLEEKLDQILDALKAQK